MKTSKRFPNSRMDGDAPTDYRTPEDLFSTLDDEFNFSMDVAASKDNTLCLAFWDEEANALFQEWGITNWCNPPFHHLEAWVDKAIFEMKCGHTTVMLLPNRTEQAWFARCLRYAYSIRFIRGRLDFSGPTSTKGGRSTEGTIIVCFEPINTLRPKLYFIDREGVVLWDES